jgi:transposase InsO family protein
VGRTAAQLAVTPLDFSRPGKPTDNAFIEAFNGRFRAECLKATVRLECLGRYRFLDVDDAVSIR